MLSQNFKNAVFETIPGILILLGLSFLVGSIILYFLDKKNKRLGKKESFGKDILMYLIMGCVFLTLGISIGVYHYFLR
jgi:hypothetical protein